jgi:hypothetical protein
MHRLTLRFFSLGSALLLVSTAALAQLQSIPAEGLAQIQAYTAEKQNRTPAEAKLSSQLLHAMRTLAGRPAVPGISGPMPGVEQFIADRVAADNTVQVTIQGDINPSLLAAIAQAGGTQIDAYPQFGLVTARLPIGSLLAVSARDDVRSIRPLDRAHTNRYVPTDDERRTMLAAAIAQGIPNGPITNSGTSQGFHAHGADLVVATGIDGTGVKICVLSDGVDSLATLQGAGQLPAVDVVAGQAGSGDEGTAMLQIVHDMAPNAALGFATAFTNAPSFAANIVTLRNAPHNCDIIVDDVTYFTEGAFQDGIIAQSVNTVTAAGALYFSSAANSGNLTHATLAGTWEGDFVAGGAAGPPISGAGTLHNFGGSTFDTLTTRGTVVVLEWSDPLGASNNDYDLYILNAAGTAVLTASTNVQNGNDDPVEIVGCSASLCPNNARVVVVLFSGATRALRVDTERGTMTIVTAGNTFGHNAAGSAFTAAATAIANAGGGLFTGGVADPVETYSSDGPRKIFYTPAGAAITPGNVLFGTGGGVTLAKVDLTATDCTHSFVPGFDPFCGTSAAAPHAAAIAGLIKSAKLTATNAQVKTALLNSALDIEAVGSDRDSGVGIVMAPAGVRALLNTLIVTKSFATNPIAVGGTSVLTITLQNTNAIAIKSVAFTDTYPANVVNAGSPNANITGAGCTGTLSATAGGTTLALTVGVVPAGTTCSYKVTVTSSVIGTYLDGTGAGTTPIALNSSAASASLTVGIAPAITSANCTSFTVGVFGTFTVTTTGSPTPAIARTAGTLPTGTMYVDNGNGTGTLSGTAVAASGPYSLTFTASNGVGSNAVQSFTLTLNVGAAASITASGGTPQNAIVNTLYGSVLQATVRDAGSNPVPGVNVAFNLPGSGPSGTFPGPTTVANALTNASGIAISPLITANGVVGAFTATATASTFTANYSLHNFARPFRPTRHRDFNGDGKDDVVWANSSTGAKVMWLMNGNTIVGASTLLTDPNWSITHYGDFNGDGKTDLLWRNTSTGEMVMWLMNGTTFIGGGTLLTSADWSVIKVGDFNGDGKMDLLWRNSVTGEVVIWLMNGTTLIGSGTLLIDTNWVPTHIADFNGDGKDDILWRNSATGQTVIWIMNGAAFAGGGVIMSDPNWTVTHVADFNVDGKAAIVWRHTSTGTALWLMNGASFASGTGLLSDPNWVVSGIDDLNGDDRIDILWRNTATGNTAAWLMNGTTLISGAGLLGPNWLITRTADLNGDGMADILWTNTATGEKVLWLMNGTSPSSGFLLLGDPNWSLLP